MTFPRHYPSRLHHFARSTEIWFSPTKGNHNSRDMANKKQRRPRSGPKPRQVILIKDTQVQLLMSDLSCPISWFFCYLVSPFLMAASYADLGAQFLSGKKAQNTHTFFMAYSRCEAKRFGFGFLAAASGNLWFMRPGRVQIRPHPWPFCMRSRDLQDLPLFLCFLGSGIGDCCFVNTQYEFQFPGAWTLRID